MAVTIRATGETVTAQAMWHARLAAHQAVDDAATVEALLAWAVLAASGGRDAQPPLDALPTTADIVAGASALHAYRAAAGQAAQLHTHFDEEELGELAALYANVVDVLEAEIDRIAGRQSL